MRFKQFMESGHMRLRRATPLNVLYNGRSVTLDNIVYVDPRFEFMNLPPITPNRKKFLGEEDFSLQLADDTWLVSKRDNMVAGVGWISRTPQGIEVPNGWADHAIFMDTSGNMVEPTELIPQ